MLAALVVFGACDTSPSDPGETPGTPPALPATASMEVDFGLFGSGGGAAAAQSYNELIRLGEAHSARVGANFITAGITVAVAQALTVLHLAIPTAVFAAAANNTPSFEDDGLWHWRYTASHQGQLWTAHLSGSVQGSDVVWDMRITAPQANPPLNDFLWYGGRSRTDRSSGTWRFYDPRNPGSSTEVVRLDWTHDSVDIHGVTVTVVSGPNVGDVLTADHKGSDRLVTFFDASDNRTVEIGWNVVTGTGYIIAPNLNGGVKACWDANQNDVACNG